MSNELIAQLCQTYNINPDKPSFPVNSMRLYYLLLGHSLSSGDGDTTARINQLVPRISAILDAREKSLTLEEPSPKSTFDECIGPIEELLELVDTPQLRQTLEHMILEMFPLQESLLASIDKFLKMDNLALVDLHAALKIRAMDSMLYASVIDQVLVDVLRPEGTKEIFLKPIHWQINISLQLNDLSDAIVYAKQDLEAKSATLVEIIRRIGIKPEQIDETVRTTYDMLISQSQIIPLPEASQSLVNDYNQLLRRTTGA